MTPAQPAPSLRVASREGSPQRVSLPQAMARDAAQVARLVPEPAARSAVQVARLVPRRQSLPVRPEGDQQQVGQTERGRIEVSDKVVAKIAARAALEVPDVGSAPSGVLGVGGGSSELGALPRARATVDGQLAFVDLTLSVRYPASVRAAAAAVREQVRSRISELAGLQVPEVDITVPTLVAELPTTRRVQ